MKCSPAEWLIAIILEIPPEKRRLYAARLLICSFVGWIISHCLLVILKESTFFNHTLNAISWIAIQITCVDVILTTDVRAETVKD